MCCALRAFVSVAVLSFAASAGLAQAVAHWPLDEAGGAVAHDSAGNFDGAVAAPAEFVVGGVAGNAMHFPGGGYVEMGDVLRFTAGDFSLSCWYKTDPQSNAHMIVAGKHTSTLVAGYFLAANAGGGYGRAGKGYFYTANSPGGEAISTATINDGQWHHVVGVYRGGVSTRIYVDGGPVEDQGTPNSLGGNAAPFMIAGLKLANGTLANLFSGMVDDVQVYDRVLCDADVEFLFRHPGEEAYPRCAGDFNGDGVVNTLDVLSFLNAWVARDPMAEMNCDLVINTQDVLAFLNAWNAGCP
jgi:hypothetical protein